jgi:hypothetical protein
MRRTIAIAALLLVALAFSAIADAQYATDQLGPLERIKAGVYLGGTSLTGTSWACDLTTLACECNNGTGDAINQLAAGDSVVIYCGSDYYPVVVAAEPSDADEFAIGAGALRIPASLTCAAAAPYLISAPVGATPRQLYDWTGVSLGYYAGTGTRALGDDYGAEAASGNVCIDYCAGGICQTQCTLTAVAITITDPTGAAGYGGVKLYDFPAGRINRLGIVADLTATAGAGGLADAWDGDISFGSTVADATATLHDPTTNDDWVLSTATTQAAAGVAATDCQNAVTEQTLCDGHTTACDVFLNYETDDADTSSGDTLAVSGTVWISWINLGDN